MASRVPNPPELNDDLHSIIGDITRAVSSSSLDAENRALVLSLSDQTKPIEEQKMIIRKLLENTGTNVALNDSDPYGDGDQTPIKTESRAQVYREMWNIGADVR
jgi:hypothetical protein